MRGAMDARSCVRYERFEQLGAHFRRDAALLVSLRVTKCNSFV
jgi:hypothetical protein